MQGELGAAILFFLAGVHGQAASCSGDGGGWVSNTEAFQTEAAGSYR